MRFLWSGRHGQYSRGINHQHGLLAVSADEIGQSARPGCGYQDQVMIPRFARLLPISV